VKLAACPPYLQKKENSRGSWHTKITFSLSHIFK
jgi:hypothetical protein